MTALDNWLNQTTRHLSTDSCAQVRTEIQEHYQSQREAAMDRGATTEEADRIALIALGSAKAANCQYRKVLLTSAEAKLLRESNWEARAVCSKLWLKWTLLAIPVAVLLTAFALFLNGATDVAQVLLLGGIAMGFLFAAPFLPVYTPSRARVYRAIRWAALLVALRVTFGPNTLQYSWLLVSCLWPMVWIEWRRISIRRKLPVAKWPKHLYL